MEEDISEGFAPFRSIVRTKRQPVLYGVPVGANPAGYEVLFLDDSIDMVPFHDLQEIGRVPDEVYRAILGDLRLSVAPHVHPSVRPSYRNNAFRRARDSIRAR
jgi:hypothetical protein